MAVPIANMGLGRTSAIYFLCRSDVEILVFAGEPSSRLACKDGAKCRIQQGPLRASLASQAGWRRKENGGSPKMGKMPQKLENRPRKWAHGNFGHSLPISGHGQFSFFLAFIPILGFPPIFLSIPAHLTRKLASCATRD